ncbi:TetR family transcriptional regulator [Mumia sp. zg.B53]|uniref:TetR/AcrR family transcriptional regulator n=1 Tax=unclassified Mumia TaxID=2621872 RepID=UPI001C6DDFB8|nr:MULTISPECIES: TetR/AcrR family transcriptional regulator [unclassified Mumia]MBW9215269.1 TetR family transcriptional regulator [Mumia sp. zg.B53]MDD9350252.1 TetR family transcriptional regulator [Mumia sp.]
MTSEEPAPAQREPGRGAPGAARTSILQSARAEFARVGYGAATVRAIARGASVDPALVIHYFGSKENLFAATIADAGFVADQVRAAVDGPSEAFSERFARAYFGAWEHPDTSLVLHSVVRSAASSATAARVVRTTIESALSVDGTSHWAPERLNLLGAQVFGIAMARYVLGTEPLASMPLEDLVAAVSPPLQALLNG